VKGVDFVFMTTNGNTNFSFKLTKITSEKGSFQVKSLSCGDYNVTVSKPGYKEQVVVLSIAERKCIDLLVEMEKCR
jgi:hypothetical protein